MTYLMDTDPNTITQSGIILGLVLAIVIAVLNGNDSRFR